MKIRGITFENGKNDFEFWYNFELSQEDEKIVLDILLKYINEGESVRGTNRILKELLNFD